MTLRFLKRLYLEAFQKGNFRVLHTVFKISSERQSGECFKEPHAVFSFFFFSGFRALIILINFSLIIFPSKKRKPKVRF